MHTWFGIILLKNVMLFLQNRYLLQNVNVHNIYKLKKGLYKILHCQTTWQYFTFFRSILNELELRERFFVYFSLHGRGWTCIY